MLEIEVSGEMREKLFKGVIQDYYMEINDKFKEDIQYSMRKLDDCLHVWETPRYEDYFPTSQDDIDGYLRNGNKYQIKDVRFRTSKGKEELTGIEIYDYFDRYCELSIGKGNGEFGTDPNTEYYILHLLDF